MAHPAASNGVWRQLRILSHCLQTKQKHETRPKGLGIDPKRLIINNQIDMCQWQPLTSWYIDLFYSHRINS